MAEVREHFGHEPQAIAVRIVLAVAGLLAASVIVVLVVLHVALRAGVMPHHVQVVARGAPIPPPPRLQAKPQHDLAAFRAEKDALLSGYAWTDASHAYARIPIERAMQIYARRHAAKANAATERPR